METQEKQTNQYIKPVNVHTNWIIINLREFCENLISKITLNSLSCTDTGVPVT